MCNLKKLCICFLLITCRFRIRFVVLLIVVIAMLLFLYFLVFYIVKLDRILNQNFQFKYSPFKSLRIIKKLEIELY